MMERFSGIGFSSIVEIPVSDIPFDTSLREMCEMNRCGCYGKNYGCPPHIGDVQTLIEKAQSYKKAIVFQSIYKLEDSFDIEGMNKGHDDFNKKTGEVKMLCNRILPDALVLGAGGCKICKVCGAVDNIPCRYPERFVASLESYSIFVSALAEVCGMKYINGVNTVTYFGAILYND